MPYLGVAISKKFINVAETEVLITQKVKISAWVSPSKIVQTIYFFFSEK